MKIKRTDAHDRFLDIQQKDSTIDIGKECQDLINKRPFGDHAFYIFAHKREIGLDEKADIALKNSIFDVNKIPTHRLVWQPRLTKPVAQENSMLFKVKPGSDNVKIIWMIPPKELWAQYEKGKMTGNAIVWESIMAFKNNKEKLEHPEDDDLSDADVKRIYMEMYASGKIPKQQPSPAF